MIKLYTFLFIVLLANSACSQTDSTVSWRSQYASISFDIYSPWKQLPTLDTEKETLTGVIDNSDGKSFIVRIGKDISKEILSDSSFYLGIKKTMLEANKENKVLSESDTVMHSLEMHRIDFLMKTDRWGWVRQINLSLRDGARFVAIQILHPVGENGHDSVIPLALMEFDKRLVIK